MSYMKKGGHIQTRPRGNSEHAKKHYSKLYKDDAKSGSFARKAASEERSNEISKKKEERNEPYTRSEFDALRRHEEELELEKLRRLKKEHDESERLIRLQDIERRKKDGQR